MPPIIIKVSSLSRDMDRLKLAEASGAKAQEPSKEKMSEARKKELRKMSQKRRSSKQSEDNIDFRLLSTVSFLLNPAL